MQSVKKYFLSVAAAVSVFFIVVFLYIVLPKLPVYGQRVVVTSDINSRFATTNSNNQAPNGSAFAADDSKKVLLPVETRVSSSVLKAAAIENSRLQYNLGWTFGGKSQFGWFIYVPLIQQTIGATEAANTPEFARSISLWQEQFGLALTGTLDDETLYKMVEYWQSRRLNNSDYPTPDKLLSAPITDFYDPTREASLLKVERETYAAYRRMIAAACKDPTLNLKTTKSGELAGDEKFLKIVSAFRSREYQAKLRRQSPNSGRAGLALNSPHFTGHALDLYVGGEPVTTKDFNRAAQVQTPVYKWLVKNAERFGFYPYYFEPWHWEYVPERLKTFTQSAK